MPQPTERKANLDNDTVSSFGNEWSRFDQSELSAEESRKIFDEYFAIFPWELVDTAASGFDMGCGTGRWARWVAPEVGHLHCIDPSAALDIARRNLVAFENVTFHRAAAGEPVVEDATQDFGYTLGVLHHVPDTEAAIASCVRLLKPGAPLLLYLYYAFDNRPWWFRAVWRLSDAIRRIIIRLPEGLKNIVCDGIAAVVYWPLARCSKLLEKMGLGVGNLPLSYYRNHSFYTMRTDARDRFGTPLERRFTRTEVEGMMRAAGLDRIRFSESVPYWCAVGYQSA